MKPIKRFVVLMRPLRLHPKLFESKDVWMASDGQKQTWKEPNCSGGHQSF